jgi:hypothetical protein
VSILRDGPRRGSARSVPSKDRPNVIFSLPAD